MDPSITNDVDPVTPRTFDNVYYQNLVAGKGLFTADEVLFTDPASQPTVTDFANSPGEFNGASITAMRKPGRVGVKTGDQGEIRTDCTAFNHEGNVSATSSVTNSSLSSFLISPACTLFSDRLCKRTLFHP